MEKKLRNDAWDAKLTEEQRWTVYERTRNDAWYKVRDWAMDEYKLPTCSSNTFYKFCARMRAQAFAHKIMQARQACAEVGKLAVECATPDDLAAAYMTMAQALAVDGNADLAEKYTKMAVMIAKQATDRLALELSKDKFEDQKRRLDAVRDAIGKAREKGGITAEVLREIEEAAKLT